MYATFQAVLTSGPVEKTVRGWVEIQRTGNEAHRADSSNPSVKKLRIT